MATVQADSLVAAVLRSPGPPYESATSYFELKPAPGTGEVTVVIAPNDSVTHSVLFGLIVGDRFCYFGPRSAGYGGSEYDTPGAMSDWNSAVGTSQGSRPVASERAARGTALMVLAFVTGHAIKLESDEPMYEVVRHEAPGRRLTSPPKVGMSFVVHQEGSWWDVAGRSRNWTFRLRIAEDGTLRDLEVRYTG